MSCSVPSAIGRSLSRVLVAYYRAPDHPMKVRLWRYLRQLQGYRPLTLAYGGSSWICVDERDWVQRSILSRGAYEPEVWGALASVASNDEVVWDIGAYIGSFTLNAAQDWRVQSVCAFEPDPHSIQVLRQNLALNANPARVYPLALSDFNGSRTLIHGPTVNAGMSTLKPVKSTGMTDHLSDALPTFTVECRTADDLVAAGEAPPPTLMKLDVEGWEYQVLRGARHLLHSPSLRAIAFETALNDKRVHSLLARYSFTISHIQRPDGERRDVENYLAVRETCPGGDPPE